MDPVAGRRVADRPLDVHRRPRALRSVDRDGARQRPDQRRRRRVRVRQPGGARGAVGRRRGRGRACQINRARRIQRRGLEQQSPHVVGGAGGGQRGLGGAEHRRRIGRCRAAGAGPADGRARRAARERAVVGEAPVAAVAVGAPGTGDDEHRVNRREHSRRATARVDKRALRARCVRVDGRTGRGRRLPDRLARAVARLGRKARGVQRGVERRGTVGRRQLRQHAAERRLHKQLLARILVSVKLDAERGSGLDDRVGEAERDRGGIGRPARLRRQGAAIAGPGRGRPAEADGGPVHKRRGRNRAGVVARQRPPERLKHIRGRGAGERIELRIRVPAADQIADRPVDAGHVVVEAEHSVDVVVVARPGQIAGADDRQRRGRRAGEWRRRRCSAPAARSSWDWRRRPRTATRRRRAGRR